MGFQWFKRPLDLRTAGDPDIKYGTSQTQMNSQAAASTAFPTRGVWGVTNTSTDETPLVHTLKAPEAGDHLVVAVEALATSSSPIHINGGTALFDDSSADMITLSSAGAGVQLVASSSGRWLVAGHFGAVLSTST